MIDRVVLTERASDAIDAAADYYANEDFELARRFYEAVDSAVDRLREYPDIGTKRHFREAALAGARMWPIPGFRQHLLFYRHIEREIELIHVIHAAQDYRLSLGDLM